jgi:dTMP kinase
LAGRNALTPSLDDRFEAEKEAFFERVEEAYAALAAAEPQRVRIIDADGDPGTVAERVWHEVASQL